MSVDDSHLLQERRLSRLARAEKEDLYVLQAAEGKLIIRVKTMIRDNHLPLSQT